MKHGIGAPGQFPLDREQRTPPSDGDGVTDVRGLFRGFPPDGEVDGDSEDNGESEAPDNEYDEPGDGLPEALDSEDETGPIDDLLFPCGRGRIHRLPLFALAWDTSRSPSEPWQVRPMGQLPARWLRGEFDGPRCRSDALRAGLITYLARGQDGWARQVRHTMSLVGPPRGPLGQFWRELARLEPYPPYRSRSAASDVASNMRKSVRYVAGHLESLRDPVSGLGLSETTARLAGLMRASAWEVGRHFAKHTFGFLLPGGAFTSLRFWFGWTPKGGEHRLHPAVYRLAGQRALADEKAGGTLDDCLEARLHFAAPVKGGGLAEGVRKLNDE